MQQSCSMTQFITRQHFFCLNPLSDNVVFRGKTVHQIEAKQRI